MITTTANQPAFSLEDWNAGLEPGTTYMFDPMHFPYPLSPLTASTLGPAFGSGTTAAFREARLPIEGVDVRHRNHYRYERWIGVTPANEDEARVIGETAEKSMQAEIGRMMERWHGEHLPAISSHLQRLQELQVGTASPTELLEMIAEAHAIHVELWTIHFRIVVPMLLAMQLFDELYADLFDSSESDAHALLVGGLSESVKAGIGLSDLAASADELGLGALFQQSDAGDMLALLEQSAAGRSFLARLQEYLEQYGLRQDLFEFSTPTWREDPSFALTSIRNYLQTGHDARRDHDAMARSAELALTGARAQLAAYPEAVRGQFEAMLQFGRQGAFLQEEHNFHIDQRGMALLRLFYLRIGERFVQAGLVDSADDIFMFSIEEIQHAVEKKLLESADALRSLVQERRLAMAAALTVAPPPFIGEPPAGPPPTSNPMERGMIRFFGGGPQQAEEPNQLKGNGGSRGTATGIARVARTLEEAKDVLPGEILVAVTTMPAWTPLFGIAAAVVTETGGPLSHCAIVAREYGIPAVVGAHGATQRIVTGQSITVDGSSGIITLED
jgi:pyruvate,water dikinase